MNDEMEDAQEHLSAEMLARYAGETLSPAELLTVSDHLAGCAGCRAALRASLGPGLRTRGWEADLLLPGDEGLPAPRPRGVAGFPRVAVFAAAAAVMLGIGWLALIRFSEPSTLLEDGVITVRRDGSVVAQKELPPEWRARLAHVARERQVALPDLAEVRPDAGGALMSAPQGAPRLRLIVPVGEVVESRQPELKWTPVEGATSYRVLLAEIGTGAEQQAAVTALSWKPPVPLAEGAIYEWEVYAIGGGAEEIEKAPLPPLPEARFRILPGAEREELAKLRAEFSASPLLLGIAAARAGLLREAEAQFEQLVAAQPQSQLARDLLESVRKAQPAPSMTNGAQ